MINTFIGEIPDILIKENGQALKNLLIALELYNEKLSLLNSSVDIMDSQDFRKAVAAVHDELLRVTEKSEKLKSLLENRFKFERAGLEVLGDVKKTSEKLDVKFKFLQGGVTIYGSLKDYATLRSVTDDIKGNEDMLNVIIANSTNPRLKKAASILLNAVENEGKEVGYLIGEISSDLVKYGLSWVMDDAIEKSLGVWVALEIAVLDAVLGISDTTKYAYQSYGLGVATETLSKDLRTNFKKYRLTQSRYYVIDKDYDKISNQFNNLANMRIVGEKRVIEMQDASHLKIIRDLWGVKTSDVIKACNENIDVLRSLIIK